ncbi:hypothetical protein P7K49_031714, partial [Saguinus oedipus]
LLFPFRESLLSSQTPLAVAGYSRSSRAHSARARGHGRAAVGSLRSLPLPLVYNLAGEEEAPPESEGGELGGGSWRV